MCVFQVTRTSSESITSVPASSASGSPSRVIYVRPPGGSRSPVLYSDTFISVIQLSKAHLTLVFISLLLGQTRGGNAGL